MAATKGKQQNVQSLLLQRNVLLSKLQRVSLDLINMESLFSIKKPTKVEVHKYKRLQQEQVKINNQVTNLNLQLSRC